MWICSCGEKCGSYGEINEGWVVGENTASHCGKEVHWEFEGFDYAELANKWGIQEDFEDPEADFKSEMINKIRDYIEKNLPSEIYNDKTLEESFVYRDCRDFITALIGGYSIENDWYNFHKAINNVKCPFTFIQIFTTNLEGFWS